MALRLRRDWVERPAKRPFAEAVGDPPNALNVELEVATATNDADEILRQMALIRRDLHEDVRGVVASAEAVTDWHRHIRNHPWLALSAAAAVGYLVVPRRHKVVATRSDVAKVRELVEEKVVEAPKAATSKRGLVGMAFGLLAPIAVKAAQSYALQYVEGYIAQLQEQQAHMGAEPPPASHPFPATGPGYKAGS